MNVGEGESTLFNINAIAEPESIGEVVYTLMVNPNLSTINYFNDFSDQAITPDSVGKVTEKKGVSLN